MPAAGGRAARGGAGLRRRPATAAGTPAADADAGCASSTSGCAPLDRSGRGGRPRRDGVHDRSPPPRPRAGGRLAGLGASGCGAALPARRGGRRPGRRGAIAALARRRRRWRPRPARRRPGRRPRRGAGAATTRASTVRPGARPRATPPRRPARSCSCHARPAQRRLAAAPARQRAAPARRSCAGRRARSTCSRPRCGPARRRPRRTSCRPAAPCPTAQAGPARAGGRLYVADAGASGQWRPAATPVDGGSVVASQVGTDGAAATSSSSGRPTC